LYKILIEKSPDFDETDNDFASDVSDISKSIEELCDCKVIISNGHKKILVMSNLSGDKLKDLAKPLFSYHFNTVRFVSMSEYK